MQDLTEQQGAVQGEATAAPQPAEPQPSELERKAKPAEPAQPAAQSGNRGGFPGWAWLLLAPAAAGVVLLWRRLRGRRGGKLQRVEVAQGEVFSVPLALAAPGLGEDAVRLAPPAALAGKSLVISDRSVPALWRSFRGWMESSRRSLECVLVCWAA